MYSTIEHHGIISKLINQLCINAVLKQIITMHRHQQYIKMHQYAALLTTVVPKSIRQGATLGSGPRYMICVCFFACCTSQKIHCHSRITRETHAILAQCAKMCYKIWYLGPLLRPHHQWCLKQTPCFMSKQTWNKADMTISTCKQPFFQLRL